MAKVWRGHPGLLEADLHAIYSIDVDDQVLRSTRSGPWLRRRVEALPFHPNSTVAARIRADIQVAVEKRRTTEKPSKTTE